MKDTILQGEDSLKRWRISILLVLLAAIILRLVYYVQNSGNPLLYMPVLDEKYYVNMGKFIAEGHWLGPNRSFFMDPLYGYILGFIFRLFGDNLTIVRIFQIVCDSLNAVLIYVIGTKVYSRNVGMISAISYAFYKVAFYYSILILKTTLSITMILLFILFILYALQDKKGWRWYGLGLFSAIMMYLRANLILMVPLSILFYGFYNKQDRRLVIKNSMLLIIGLVSIMLIVTLRNYYVSGEMSVLNTQAGRLLYSSNNPDNLTGRYNTPGFSRPHPEESEWDFHKEAERRLGKKMTPGQVSRYWTGETVHFLSDNPKVVPILLYNKLKWTIGNCEVPVNHSFYVSSGFSSLAGLLFPNYAFALAFGIPGLFIGLLKNRNVAWLFIPILAILVTVLIFYSSSRLRMPMVPFLLIGGGICFSQIMEYLKRREVKRLFPILLSIFVFGVSSSIISCPPRSGSEEFYLAKAFWQQRDFMQARNAANIGAEKFPDQSRFQILLGMISLSENRPEEAVQHNLNALKIDPNNIDALYNMGLVYIEANKPKEAIMFFKKALSIEKRPIIYFGLAMAYEKMGDIFNAKKFLQDYHDQGIPVDPRYEYAEKHLIELKKIAQ